MLMRDNVTDGSVTLSRCCHGSLVRARRAPASQPQPHISISSFLPRPATDGTEGRNFNFQEILGDVA